MRRTFVEGLFHDLELIDDLPSTLAVVDLQFLKLEADGRAEAHQRVDQLCDAHGIL